ncbi:hypothetical protein EON66_07335 [archaeon]|nr:MAG: hypothetical protein EON66_07335 [archaeon]
MSRCSSDVGATLPTRSAFEAAGSSEDSATAAAAEVALHRHATPAAAAARVAGKVVPGAPHLPTVILSRSCSEGSAHTMQSSGSGSGMNAAAAAAHIPVTLLLGLDTRYFTADAAEDAVTACLTLPSPATFVQGCRESTALCASARASEC